MQRDVRYRRVPKISSWRMENTGYDNRPKSAKCINSITSDDVRKLVKRALGADVELVDYTIRTYSEDKLGFLSSHQRLEIRVKDKGQQDSRRFSKIPFFVKSIPYDVPIQAEYVKEKGVFEQEAYFFEKLVPELRNGFDSEPWAPECYIVKNDCLVLEELCLGGFRMSEKLLNEEEIRAGLATVARLHAASLHAETRLGRPLNEIFPAAFEEKAFLNQGNQYRWYLAGVDVAVKIAELLGLDAAFIPSACQRVFDAVKPSLEKQNVASHGDLWSNNLMFDDSRPTRCRLVDFQLARYSPLGHDIAQFIYLCASRRFRDAHTSDMLRYYYQSLVDCLEANSTIPVKVPSWRELELSYEEQRLGALVTAVIYFPTVLLDGKLGARIMNDSESYEKFVMVDRRDAVVENMQRDPQYGKRLNESVRELVEMSFILDQLPNPC